jgi:predicted nucleotidyltransferase
MVTSPFLRRGWNVPRLPRSVNWDGLGKIQPAGADLCYRRYGRNFRAMSEQAAHNRVCPNADDVIAILRAHEVELRAAGVRHASLFGSVARGDASPDSDVDLAVELDREAHIGLIGLCGLEQRIGDMVGWKVDLLPLPVEKPHLRANIERDRKLVF